MDCDVCSRNMTPPHGEYSIMGVRVTIIPEEGVDESLREWLVEHMHPYEADRVYRVCFPCWLASLGILPEKRENGL